MKGFAVVALCVVFAVIVTAVPADRDTLYTSRWDDIDVDQVINNERLLNSYADCLRSKKPCTKEGQALKDVIPDALQTGCEKCNETQKTKARKVMKVIISKHPELFLELEDLFDKGHVYRVKYADRIREEGVELPALKA